ncbi:hypothetical protein DYB32_007655 [Aphanomyces invadans]|uniref:tRNA-uridine aminocarboxypropyltransferase 1 n=1 Tax=Aphanomyces invadans TaxID=157072 RepID=A0A418AR10_9STRA|nr:hypothetical protein DYB32_007655 [Aphanomyces invadans]
MDPDIEPATRLADETATAEVAKSNPAPGEWTRQLCPGCNKSCKYYCAVCYLPIGAPLTVEVPRIRLPLQVDILFQDKQKKSTAPHGKVVAPDDIAIIPYPFPEESRPQYDAKEAVVVYPSIDAYVIDELEDLDSLKTLIFIDTPWQKAPTVLNDPALSHLRCVKLARPPLESKYWRYHSSGKGCISTIEAVHLLLVEYVAAKAQRAVASMTTVAPATPSCLDPLLFFFHLVHDHIMHTHKTDPKRQIDRAPMSEAEKERQRLMRSQKEAGRKRKLENKLAFKAQIAAEVEAGAADAWPKKKCFNCGARTHQARECLDVCRYCKVEVHFNGDCPMKGQRPARATKVTKAI